MVQNWIEVGLPNNKIHTINTFAFSGKNIFAGTDNGVFLSTNNGTSWIEAGLTNDSIKSLNVNGTSIFAVTIWENYGGDLFQN